MSEQMKTCGPCFRPTPHRYTGDMWRCMRCEATAQAAEIGRLRAELARLTPSGQVAEDVLAVKDAMDGYDHPALSRLAAKAQERDAAVADNAAKTITLRVILKVLKNPATTADDVHEARKYAAGALSNPHPGAALLKERQEREETVRALAARLGARVAPGVATCMCYLTAPERCNNCEDRDLVAKVLP